MIGITGGGRIQNCHAEMLKRKRCQHSALSGTINNTCSLTTVPLCWLYPAVATSGPSLLQQQEPTLNFFSVHSDNNTLWENKRKKKKTTHTHTHTHTNLIMLHVAAVCSTSLSVSLQYVTTTCLTKHMNSAGESQGDRLRGTALSPD